MAMNTTAKTEIVEQIDRSLRALDERDFTEIRRYYTADVVADYPIGRAEGLDRVIEQTEAGVLRYERTQHLGVNYLVDVGPDGHSATAGWNQICHHVHPGGDVFTVGARCRAELVQTDFGWQVKKTTMQVVWTTGRPPALVEV
ncbi:nuclear transport factor 2 family protein [Nocardia alni]|uniref:nuclear transport factor 2 family protein n=1 Tax=Nocardia alni TaxID=2815723 RepID=UPI001C24C107|nr:nuclear transport factor 2 family protein [Nocardia alni]